jgi:hypothetical protein
LCDDFGTTTGSSISTSGLSESSTGFWTLATASCETNAAANKTFSPALTSGATFGFAGFGLGLRFGRVTN